MQGIYLRFYVTEFQEHKGILTYEWLLEEAKRQGIPGCSVFRTIAGYGRHGRLHEETFFELAADLPIEVGFVLSEDQADTLLKVIRQEGLRLFYVRHAAEFGVLESE